MCAFVDWYRYFWAVIPGYGWSRIQFFRKAGGLMRMNYGVDVSVNSVWWVIIFSWFMVSLRRFVGRHPKHPIVYMCYLCVLCRQLGRSLVGEICRVILNMMGTSFPNRRGYGYGKRADWYKPKCWLQGAIPYNAGKGIRQFLKKPLMYHFRFWVSGILLGHFISLSSVCAGS